MGLSSILAAIRTMGNTRVEEIKQEAQVQADELLASARSEAQEIEKQAYLTAVMPASKERARIIHHARLDAMRLVGNLREQLVDTAMEGACDRLGNIRNDDIYITVLGRLTKEALGELQRSLGDMQSAILDADPRDQALLESILLDLGVDLQVNYSLSCWGGLIAKSDDGKVVVINTLESRLARATPYLRPYLAALFENEIPASQMEEVSEKVKVN